MSSISPARAAAFRILLEVERGKAHSDDLLRGKSVSSLSEADRNLTTALVLGVLRWELVLDDVIRPLLSRPAAKLDVEVRIALRLAAFQLHFMDRIPARAAIDESVELTKRAGHQFASRMVNAVLRKLATSADAAGPVKLTAMQAYPEWMTERWTRTFGAETTQSICEAGQVQAAQTVRLVSPGAEHELLERGIVLRLGELLSAARHVESGDITELEVFATGGVRLQDEGSQLVAELAGRGDAILDCCAAPGGKTLILAERNPGAQIVACEASPARFEALRQRLSGFADRIECRSIHAEALSEQDRFDVVLADVPCSGTGTLGRNPEIRHRLTLQDLPRQAERQIEILRSALCAVRPGGHVVYSTCSLECEENEEVVSAVLQEKSRLKVVPVGERLEDLVRQNILTQDGATKLASCATAEGYLRLIPGKFQTDGFFVAVLEKAVH